MSNRPIIAVPADRKLVGIHPFHMVGEKYLNAIKEVSMGVPWIVPALGYDEVTEDILNSVDGVFLTGSYSNIEPHHYGKEESRPGTLHDPERDGTVLPLIGQVLDRGIPLFAVCRGFQELNVHLGGTIHQHLHEIEGNFDHRENNKDDINTQYGPAHKISIHRDSMLFDLLGETEAEVNSLHGQGINKLAPNVTVEAEAEDGVIEAFKVNNAKAFAYAVQWHPEWKANKNKLSRLLFSTFGSACSEYAKNK